MPGRASQVLNHSQPEARSASWSGSVPPNHTECAEMWKGCGSSSVAVPVGVSLLLLLLLLCGIGCVWRWKHRSSTQFAFPRFLQRRSNKKRDYAKPASGGPLATTSRPKVLVQTRDHKAAVKETDLHNNYENLEAGPPEAKEADKGLYENTRQANFEDHIYGNQTSSEYCSSRRPCSPEDEDIYILPDAY